MFWYFGEMDTDAILRDLDENGFAIVPNVLDADECLAVLNGMWSTLEHWTQDWDRPIREDDPSTWRSYQELFPSHHMLLQHYGIGHAQFVWDLRENHKILSVFSKMWGDEDLLVSFDGASFHMPPEITNVGWRTNEKLHVDQSYTRSSFECVQSWITPVAVRPGDATLQLLRGSQNLHAEFAREFSILNKDDWNVLEPEHVQFYLERGCTLEFVECSAGSLVIWDSRTVHSGVRPMRGRAQPNIRCVVYLCYQPRVLATEAELRKKRRAFEDGRMTSHWPCRVRLFPKTVHSYGKTVRPITPLEPPTLTDVGLRLAGF
jgi:hypothetical protein